MNYKLSAHRYQHSGRDITRRNCQPAPLSCCQFIGHASQNRLDQAIRIELTSAPVFLRVRLRM